MTQTSFWSKPTNRVKPSKISDALERLDVQANWFIQHKPTVSKIYVTQADYAALQTGGHGISQRDKELRYRGFSIVIAP